MTICSFESQIFMQTNRLPHTSCIMFNPKFDFSFTLWVHFDISFHAKINKNLFTFMYLTFSIYNSGLTKSFPLYMAYLLFALISVTICNFEFRIGIDRNRRPHTLSIVLKQKMQFPIFLWVHFVCICVLKFL